MHDTASKGFSFPADWCSSRVHPICSPAFFACSDVECLSLRRFTSRPTTPLRGFELHPVIVEFFDPSSAIARQGRKQESNCPPPCGRSSGGAGGCLSLCAYTYMYICIYIYNVYIYISLSLYLSLSVSQTLSLSSSKPLPALESLSHCIGTEGTCHLLVID